MTAGQREYSLWPLLMLYAMISVKFLYSAVKALPFTVHFGLPAFFTGHAFELQAWGS